MSVDLFQSEQAARCLDEWRPSPRTLSVTTAVHVWARWGRWYRQRLAQAQSLFSVGAGKILRYRPVSPMK